MFQKEAGEIADEIVPLRLVRFGLSREGQKLAEVGIAEKEATREGRPGALGFTGRPRSFRERRVVRGSSWKYQVGQYS